MTDPKRWIPPGTMALIGGGLALVSTALGFASSGRITSVGVIIAGVGFMFWLIRRHPRNVDRV